MAKKRELAGHELITVAFGMLRRDPAMLWLVAIGTLAATVAFALVAVPLGLWMHAAPARGPTASRAGSCTPPGCSCPRSCGS